MCVCEPEVCVYVWLLLVANELRQLQKLIMSAKVNYDTNGTLDTPAEWLCMCLCVVSGV